MNVERIAEQIDDPVLPVYIQRAPDSAPPTAPNGLPAPASSYPAPVTFIPELTEGPHMGYAIQWFTFAAILWLGYPFYFLKETRDAHN